MLARTKSKDNLASSGNLMSEQQFGQQARFIQSTNSAMYRLSLRDHDSAQDSG